MNQRVNRVGARKSVLRSIPDARVGDGHESFYRYGVWSGTWLVGSGVTKGDQERKGSVMNINDPPPKYTKPRRRTTPSHRLLDRERDIPEAEQAEIDGRIRAARLEREKGGKRR